MNLKVKRRAPRRSFDIKKPISLIVCVCLALCLIVSSVNPVNTSAAQDTQLTALAQTSRFSGDDSVADPSTDSTFMNIMGDVADGGRYTGRVWIDKSVYNNSVTSLDGFSNINVPLNPENGEDFLIEYSVLGSSRILNTSASVPLDVVLLLDISTSMNNEPGGGTPNAPIRGVLEQSNELMKKVFELNDQNRVGVVVYGGGSKTILPLDHYTKSGSTEFLTMNQTKHPANDPGYVNRYFTQVVGTGINSSGVRVQNSNPYFFADSTYLQGALYDGMEMLASADPTFKSPNGQTAVNPDGSQNTRVPALIVLSDGGTNTFTVDNQSHSWWRPFHNDVIASASTNPNNNAYYYPPRGGNPLYSPFNEANETAREARTVSVLMTAALMKAQVDANYGRDLNGYSIVFRGNAITNPIEREQLLTTLDPATYFTRGSSNAATRRAYEYWEQYVLTGSVNIPYSGVYLGGTYSGTQMIRKIPATNSLSAYNDEVRNIGSVNYIKEMFTAEEADALENIFQQIVTNISGVAFHPVSSNLGNAEVGVTFTDPLGEYMDVKTIKGVMLFGNFYSQVSARTSGNTTTYTLQKTNIRHPSYVNDTYIDLSAIQINEVKDPATHKSVLTINLPEEALPVRCDTINLGAEINPDTGAYNVLSYTSNRLNPYEAYPIRIFAAVGAEDSVLTDPNDKGSKINLAKIDPDYIKDNTLDDKDNTLDGGSVAFYANLYTGQTGDELTKLGGGTAFADKTIGDMTVDFFPTEENKYYYFQENHVIYTQCSEDLKPADEGAGAEYTKTAGTSGVKVSDPLTDINDIENDKIYYLIVNFYAPIVDNNGNQIGNKGKYVEWVLPRTGEMLKNSVTTIPTPDYLKGNTASAQVVATATGYDGVRHAELNRFASLKISNPTDTAETNFIPWMGIAEPTETEYRYVAVEGNNGRLTVKSSTLVITKAVMLPDGTMAGTGASNLIPPDKDFEFKITFDNLGSTTLYYETLIYNPENGSYTVNSANPLTLTLDAAGTGTFTLKANEGIRFLNLSESQKYTVAETDPSPDFTIISRPATGIVSSDVATMPKVDFVNQYNTQIELTNLSLVKKMDGDREIKPGDTFTFVMRCAESTPTAPLPSGHDVIIDSASGTKSVAIKYTHTEAETKDPVNVPIGDIEFSAPGVYRYVIWEQPPDTGNSIPGVSYDGTIYRYSVTVGVNPNDKSKLSVTEKRLERMKIDENGIISYETLGSDNNIPFTNTYNITQIQTSINAQKILNGGILGDRQFQFELEQHGSYTVTSEDKDRLGDSPDNQTLMDYFANKNFGDSCPMPGDVDSSVVIRNDESGNVQFKDITFSSSLLDGLDTESKALGIIYKYTVKEVLETGSNITQDDGIRTVYLHAYMQNTDDGEVIAVDRFGDNMTATEGGKPFVNTISYSPGALELGVTKTMEGREFSNTDQFTFILTGLNDAPMPDGANADNAVNLVLNNLTGTSAKAVFPAINYTFDDLKLNAAGTAYENSFVYTIREMRGSIQGVLYDEAVYRITADVSATPANEEITAVIRKIEKIKNGTSDEITSPEGGWTDGDSGSQTGNTLFSNNAITNAAFVELKGTKTLIGRNMEQGEFVFVIRECEADGTPKPNIQPIYTTNSPGTASGNDYKSEIVILDPNYFAYAEEGEHYYLLTETDGGNPDVIYDPTQFLIQVKAEKDENGNLNAHVETIKTRPDPQGIWTETAGAEFRNTASSIPATFAPMVLKSLTGDFPDDELFIYRFVIAPESDYGTEIKMPDRTTARVIEDGTAYFDAITFTKDSIGKTYKFKISEIPTDYSDIDYDGTVWTLIVPVAEKDGSPFIDVSKVTYVNDKGETLTDSAAFNNSWKPVTPPGASKPWIVSLDAQKEVLSYDNEIFDLAANPFTFEIIPFETNPSGDPIDAPRIVQNTADGAVHIFENAEYHLPGKYNYLIQEVSSNNYPGIILDDTVYIVTVEVTRLSSGILSGSLSVTDGAGKPLESHEMSFVNRYHPGQISVIAEGVKYLNDGLMQGGEFKFELIPIGAVIQDGGQANALLTEDAAEENADLTENTEDIAAGDKKDLNEVGENNGNEHMNNSDKPTKNELLDDDLNNEISSEQKADEIEEAEQSEQASEEKIEQTEIKAELNTDEGAAAPDSDVIMPSIILRSVAGVKNAVFKETEEIGKEATPVQDTGSEAEQTANEQIIEDNQSNEEEQASDDAQAVSEEQLLDEALPAVQSELTAENMPMPPQSVVYNTSAGTFRFGSIIFLSPGTYTYQIKESPVDSDGYTSDSKIYNMVVEVSEGDNGFFSAKTTITDQNGEEAEFMSFENNNLLHPDITIVKDQTLNDGDFTQDILNGAEKDIVTYRLTVSNNSQRDAVDVIVTDPVPEGLTIAENTISDGGYFEDGKVIWRLGVLKAGEQRHLTFDAVIPKVEQYTEWVNLASVNYKNNPNNPPGGREEKPSNSVQINSDIPSLEIYKEQSSNGGMFTAETLPVSSGTVLEYRITVTNTSQLTINDAVVTDIIPSGLAVISESVSSGGMIEGEAIIWQTGVIAPGASVQLSFKATVPVIVGTAAYVNTAQAAAAGLEPVSSNTVQAAGTQTLQTSPRSPKTYDNTPILPYLIIVGAGAAAIAGVLIWRKKRNK